MKYWIVGLIALVVGALGIFLITNDSDDNDSLSNTSQTQTTQTEESEAQPEQEPQEQASDGQYIDYSANAIAENKGKTKLLFFSAVWCSECLQVERNILASSIPSDVVIIKADYDKDTDLIKKYQVPDRTYFVQVDDSGEKVTGWRASAFDGIDEILEQVI